MTIHEMSRKPLRYPTPLSCYYEHMQEFTCYRMGVKKVKKKISSSQLQLFDTIGKEGVSQQPAKRMIEEKIIRLETELKHGQMDYNRNRPSLKAIEEAAQTKNYNRAKVDGIWYDVKFCKYLVRFMHDWARRRSALEWEIQELKKMLED
jgi:hypothetical protein